MSEPESAASRFRYSLSEHEPYCHYPNSSSPTPSRGMAVFAEYLRGRLLLPERDLGDYVGWVRAFLVFAWTRLGFGLVFRESTRNPGAALSLCPGLR